MHDKELLKKQRFWVLGAKRFSEVVTLKVYEDDIVAVPESLCSTCIGEFTALCFEDIAIAMGPVPTNASHIMKGDCRDLLDMVLRTGDSFELMGAQPDHERLHGGGWPIQPRQPMYIPDGEPLKYLKS